ncbi:MAG: diacylglycerol kinase family protein [Porphyromonas sp.]|nr:diacylglycerol kinase family protein [Porphyromonas sp.]
MSKDKLDHPKGKWSYAFSWQRVRASFGHAWRGVRWLFRKEANAHIHLVCMLLVLAAGLIFNIQKGEWIAILLCIALVLSLEAVNSSIEQLSDQVSSEYTPKIRDTKDLAAGAVLIAAIVALTIGLIIFVPYILQLL